MLVTAAIWNLLPRQCTHPSLPMCHTDMHLSAIFQVDFLALHWIRIARLRTGHDMASGGY